MKNIFILLLFVGCALTKEELSVRPEKTLVFIQDYHLDGKSWDDVKNRIPADQFGMMNLDRMGRDRKKPASLKDIAKMSCSTIPLKSILVAHSYGGAIATDMMGICPFKILKIIYISAVVPKDGEKPFDRVKNQEAQKLYAKAVTMDGKKITPRGPKTFYKIMDPNIDLNKNLPTLYPEYLSLNFEKVSYNPVLFKSLPKVYIYTENDPVVPMDVQKMFVRGAYIDQTEGIASGHYPMISQPEKLAGLILLWAKK